MDIEKQQNLIIAWLKDAYAMENGLAATLKAYADEADKYPSLQDKLNDHLEITKDQAERLKARLEELGENTSKIKNLSGEIIGRIQGFGTKLAKDSVIKNAISGFAGEHFEIACYSALAAAASKINDTETVALAEAIMMEEREMADWMEANLPDLVEEFLDTEDEK